VSAYPSPVHLREIRLATRRFDEQRALYAGALGLPATDEEAALAVGIGDARLVLVPGEPTPQHFAVRIPSASYADALAWLGERVELLRDEDGSRAFAFPDWNADSAYFADPDGNIVELIAHHDLPDPYAPPFGPSALLGICEAGMPVADVGAFLDELERRTGAGRWSGNRETFAAAGTKAGSLIVVRSGRVWYPTDSAAATRPPLAVGTDAGTLPW
jgi:catechol 2,3-dioxygenase-like lactoylglutathione lyase family enzyme